MLSLELAGHFTGMAFDPALLYEAEIDGLRAPRGPAEARGPQDAVSAEDRNVRR